MRHDRRSIIAIVVLVLAAASACSDDETTEAADGTAVLRATTSTPTPTSPDATVALTAVARHVLGSDAAIPGVLLHVDAPEHGVDISVAAGLDDRMTANSLAPDAGVRIASITKTFVATAVLRLVEQGSLLLDDPIAGRLAPETVEALRVGGYQPDVITVRHLLVHSSGIYHLGRDDTYIAAVSADPNRRWTRLEQVRWATDHGQPVGAPGELYDYSDTGYILLGEIVERASGAPLPEAVRTLVDYDALGLDETYWESLEPVPSGVASRAHQYIGEFDGHGMDPSFDLYGAAGLVSTVDDLSAFYRALLRGEVFDSSETLATMLEVPASNVAEHAGMGIFRHDLAGVPCWGHAGFWGNLVLTCPDVDVTIAVSILQNAPGSGYEEDDVFIRAFEAVSTG